jgi:hypothetical protein
MWGLNGAAETLNQSRVRAREKERHEREERAFLREK